MTRKRVVPALQAGAVRFVCWVTPASAVQQAARKKGWTPAGETAPLDHVEAENYERAHSFPALDEAVAFGQRWIDSGQDFWGVVHVYRETFRRDRITDRLEWKREHQWWVSHEGIDQDEPVEPDDEWGDEP